MSDPKTAEQVIRDRDKDKRVKDEEEILVKAHALTNGDQGNPKLTGEVLEWLVGEMIDLGTLIRILSTQLPLCQLKTDCVLAHGKKRWVVRLFGVSYALPVSVSVIVMGWLVFMACRSQGIM